MRSGELRLLSPIREDSSPTFHHRRISLWLGVTAFIIVLVNLIHFSSGETFTRIREDWLSGDHRVDAPKACSTPAPAAEAAPEPPLPEWPDAEDEHILPLHEIQAILGRTKGVFARDYSLGLGWNNMRYIIEGAIMHADLLNRTLVLPSFVYARACQFDIHACAAVAPMVNRGKAVGWTEWEKLPLEKQMGWRLPIGKMIDLPHLRKTHNVITVADWLRFQGLPPELEESNGAWNRTSYHSSPWQPTLRVIANADWDPSNIIRVDKINGTSGPEGEGGRLELNQKTADLLSKALVGKAHQFLELEEARQALKHGAWQINTNEELADVISRSGWQVLHTFAGVGGMDFLKSVERPIMHFSPPSALRGFVDDWGSTTEDVLLLEGEVHAGRKPAFLRFTTVEKRDDFARIVLYALRPVAKVRMLAESIAERMQERAGGRMWLGAHMRRGDFVGLGWAMESKIEDHLGRIKRRLARGREILREIERPEPFDIPDAKVDNATYALKKPFDSDPFYLATDERTEEGQSYLRMNGAVLIGDLLTMEDARLFGWELMFVDYLALVEQMVLSHSAYFYAHSMSSVAGGVVNLRAGRGADRRTTLID